jgi:hypothetical protein
MKCVVLTPSALEYRAQVQERVPVAFPIVQSLLRQVRDDPTRGATIASLSSSSDRHANQLARLLADMKWLPRSTLLNWAKIPPQPNTANPVVIAFTMHVQGSVRGLQIPLGVRSTDISGSVFRIGITLDQGGVMRFSSRSAQA